MRCNLLFLVFAGILVFSPFAHADVKLPAIFGDSMVLQQKSNVTVWGWAEPGEEVSVKGNWNSFSKSTKANDDGKWSVKIKTPKAGKTVKLTVKGNNKIVINDILIGEVWICSGQSNMEHTLEMLGDEQNLRAAAESTNPQIRLFTVEQKFSTEPEDDCVGTWQVCEPNTVKDFSATGYYFGKKLNETLNVPIGLISSNWGGTASESWTSREALKPFEEFSTTLRFLKDPESTGEALQQEYEVKLAQWEEQVAQIDPGTIEGWYQKYIDGHEFNDWQDMKLPMRWSLSGTGLKDTDGIVWFRQTINLPPDLAKIDLEMNFGPIDDVDTTWVNGTKIGSTTNSWNMPRRYSVPASVLTAGENTIAVRVVDITSDGGFTSCNPDDMRIGKIGAEVSDCISLATTWKYKISTTDQVPGAPKSGTYIDHNSPTALYNGMIAPLTQFRIAGVIWYQGESNCYDPILYRSLFPAMITDWRTHWNQGDFPFYYVQIAPYDYGIGTPSEALREAQMMTLHAVPNVGMAVTMDLGEKKNIHPKNKQDVGDRLARWALAKTYKKKKVVYSGPIYKEMKVVDGKVRISFDNVDGGLVAGDNGLTDFEIAGADSKFVPAKAVIDGDTVIVSNETVKEPVAVRYDWSNWVEGSLFSKTGLPTSSFRTDNWPLE